MGNTRKTENSKLKGFRRYVFQDGKTYDEIVDILDIKHIDGSTSGCVLPSGTYKSTNTSSMIDSVFPNQVKVNITIDDIRLRTDLTTNKIKTLLKSPFLYTILGFTKFHSGPLGDVDGFV